MPSRPTPLDLVFADLADRTFPVLRTGLDRANVDPRDRDAWLMTPEVIELLHDLRSPEGIGEAMDQMVAFVHHTYLFWLAGRPVSVVEAEQLPAMVAPEFLADEPVEVADPATPDASAGAEYTQFPERRIWATAIPGEPHEPLDGCFTYHIPGKSLRVLGIFGLRADRDGFSAVEVAGPRPIALERPDGVPLFTPTMPGAASAGLHEIVGEEELLELGWRTRELAAGPLAGRAAWTR